MSDNRKPYDRDVEENGTPKWFAFVIEGGAIEMTEKGPSQMDGKTYSFDWPFPRHIRIAHYLRRAARTSKLDDEDN